MIENKKYLITGFNEDFIKTWLENLENPEKIIGNSFISNLKKNNRLLELQQTLK